MAILTQLGIDGSILFQIIIFCVAYFVLSRVVFMPYANAYEQRLSRTTGDEEVATQAVKKAQELRSQYESKAKEVSGKIKTIFDEYRVEAGEHASSVVSKAREESAMMIEAARGSVSKQVQAAEGELKKEVAVVAQEINKKMLM